MEGLEQNLSPEAQAKVNEIISKEEGYEAADPSPADQERFLGGYSFSAMVFSAFYYSYMKDKLFLTLTIVAGVIFFPVLFLLPFFARRRAWEQREWRSFNQFTAIQKKWDKAAIYGMIIFVMVFSLVGYYELKLVNSLVNSAGITNMKDVKQLQNDVQGSLQY